MHNLVIAFKKRQRGIVRLIVHGVFEFHIPFAGLFIPAMTHRALGNHQASVLFIHTDELPVTIADVFVITQFIGTQQSARRIVIAVFLQLHQECAVSVLLGVLKEIGGLFFMVKFFQDDMGDRHPERAITAGMQRNPLVGIFTDLGEIGREYDCLGAVMSGFREKVAIRRTCHVQARPHVGDHF